jgi:1-acyl-sn-glycerol-3-phosphate acyltransferase
VTIKVGPPVPLKNFDDRKDLALKSERAIRRDVLGILRGRPDDPDLMPVEPSEESRRVKLSVSRGKSEKWT